MRNDIKTTREVAKELRKLVSNGTEQIFFECIDWNFYMALTYFNDKHEYCTVTLMETIEGKRKFVIPFTTKNLKEMVELLKSIEPTLLIERITEEGENETI